MSFQVVHINNFITWAIGVQSRQEIDQYPQSNDVLKTMTAILDLFHSEKTAINVLWNCQDGSALIILFIATKLEGFVIFVVFEYKEEAHKFDRKLE